MKRITLLYIVLTLVVPATTIAQDSTLLSTAPTILPGKGLKQYDFFYAGEQKNKAMYIIRNGKVTWSYIDTTGRGEVSDAVLMSNGNVVFAHQHGVSVITKDKKLVWNYTCPNDHEIHTTQPIGKHHIVYIENADTPKVKVVNITTGKLVNEFEIPVGDRTKAHPQFRHARLTSKGTYLVAHMDLNKIIEYDFNGRQLSSIDFPFPWSAVELINGNILAVSNKNIVREINRKGETVWEFKPSHIPGYRFFGMQTACRLPNGNTVVNNWFNQWKRYKIDSANLPVQFVEVTPGKNVVWALREWLSPSNLGPSTVIQFLDDKKRAEDVRFGNLH
jgi:hypothetical protein